MSCGEEEGVHAVLLNSLDITRRLMEWDGLRALLVLGRALKSCTDILASFSAMRGKGIDRQSGHCILAYICILHEILIITQRQLIHRVSEHPDN